MGKRRPQCTVKGCRKLQMPDSDFCKLHQEQAAAKGGNGQAAVESTVMMVDEMKRLKLVAVDLEIQNLRQAAELIDHEQRQSDYEYEQLKRKRSQRKLQTLDRQRKKERELTALLQEIATEFKLDIDQMAVDETTGVVRDLGVVTEANSGN